MEVASLSSFRYDPHKFYGWFHSLAKMIWTAEPNAAHAALAAIHQTNWRGSAAERAFQRAVELSPNDPDLLFFYARFKLYLSRHGWVFN